MNYLVTAAGKGSRFLEEGIKPPKPLIKVFGNELLIWSLNSFNLTYKDKIFITTYKKHFVRRILEKKIQKIYPDVEINWLELEEIPNGQLLTAIKTISHFKIKGKLIIHNCDTFFRFDDEQIKSLLKEEIFGVIPCFKSNGEHWSFVKHSNIEKSLVTEVKEKVRISDNCSVGTYIFSSTEKLISLFEDYFEKNISDSISEFYISPIYQYAIEKNLKVKITSAKEVRVFGTPKELLKTFGISFEELLGENSWKDNQIKTLVVDIDKTICEKKDSDNYDKAVPIDKVCNALKKANSEGVYIILFTSRNMRTFKGSLGLINKITAPILFKWLEKYDIPFDEIYFGKPWGNSVSYIDDKNMRIEDFFRKY